MNGGDDDDYRPIHTHTSTRTRTQPSPVVAASSSSATRELASRLRSQRQRAARYVVDDSTEESSSDNDHAAGSPRARARVNVVGRLQTSNVRRAMESPSSSSSPVENPREGGDGVGEYADSQKVRLAYSKLMASCSSQLITTLIGCLSFFHLSRFFFGGKMDGRAHFVDAFWFVGKDRAVRLLRMMLTV
jgi:hypothetical protein